MNVPCLARWSILLTSWIIAATVPRALGAPPPNVILIVTDDTGYGDLSAHGHPILRTPRLDTLRHEAVSFTDFHVSPTCAPTRAALLTGRHEFKNGITHTILERERLTPSAITLAQVLQQAGYATGIFGKWHLGDETEYRPDRRGFDETFIHGGGGIGQTYPGSCGDAPGNRYFDPTILHNGVFEKTTGFCTDVFTDQALRWIESVKGRRPFFCYLPYNAAHEPVSCPPQDRQPYEGRVPENLATFYGMIANIDRNVGKILDQLVAWNLERETIVVFMNDNGVYGPAAKIFNAGMRGSKASPWLGGTRAVSLWRWPGTWEPHEVDALTAHLDFFPTIAELAHAPLDRVRSQVEGRSLVPLLKNGAAPWPERTLFTHVGRWPKGASVNDYKYTGCSVRSGAWHLVSEGNPQRAKPKGWQLFDVKADPGEQRNIAADHPEIVQRLDVAYDEFWQSAVPLMVNETVIGPNINPFQELYWKQFGASPSAADLERMNPNVPRPKP